MHPKTSSPPCSKVLHALIPKSIVDAFTKSWARKWARRWLVVLAVLNALIVGCIVGLVVCLISIRRWQKDVMSTLDLQNTGGASPKAIVTKDYIGLPILHLVFSALLVSGTFRVILNKRDFITAFVLFAKYAYTLADPVVIYQYMRHHVPGPTFGSCYRRLGGALALAEGTEAEAAYFCRVVTGPVQALMIVGYLVGFVIMLISIPLTLVDDDSTEVVLPQSSRTGPGTKTGLSIEDGMDSSHEKEIQPEQSQSFDDNLKERRNILA